MKRLAIEDRAAHRTLEGFIVGHSSGRPVQLPLPLRGAEVVSWGTLRVLSASLYMAPRSKRATELQLALGFSVGLAIVMFTFVMFAKSFIAR
jgi:hypothetical protein